MQAVLLKPYNFIILGYEKTLMHTGIMINSLMSAQRLIIQQARHDIDFPICLFTLSRVIIVYLLVIASN